MSGGVYRIKHHVGWIKGNVSKCPKSTKENKEKCANDLNKAKAKKLEKRKHEDEVREEVNIIDEDAREEEPWSRKNAHFPGPIDKFASTINHDSSIGQSKKMRQSNISETLFKERTHSVHQHLARRVYESGIPFHAIDNDSFKRFYEAVGQFGPGYQSPSQYLLREPLLKEEVERTKKSLKKQEDERKVNGCSIMTDAWSDKKRKSIMNLCVNYKECTTFLSSKEDSKEAHKGKYIFHKEYFTWITFLLRNILLCSFGKPLVASGCAKNDDKFDLVGWWSIYGNGVHNLQMMATQVLSLTTSSSGCERNWSAFEGIHTKKRNRLNATRLNNLGLSTKRKRAKEKEVDVLLANDASKVQGWVVEGGDDEEVLAGLGLTWEAVGEASGADSVLEPRRSARNVEVRELHEEDFVSNEKSEDEGNEEYDFESD